MRDNLSLSALLLLLLGKGSGKKEEGIVKHGWTFLDLIGADVHVSNYRFYYSFLVKITEIVSHFRDLHSIIDTRICSVHMLLVMMASVCAPDNKTG